VHPVTFRDPFERTLSGPRIVAVIPARHDSTRLPGKALADIAGRPMIEHVYRRAAAAPSVDAVVVATDDARIAAAVERFGGVARMTRPTHRTGTDRIAEVAADLACAVIVNVQGDEPLIEPGMIEEVLSPLLSDAAVEMATLRKAIADQEDYVNPNVVKVVADRAGDALYFSRAPVPYVRLPASARTMETAGAFRHIGLYAYRRAFVLTLAALPRTPLEIAESLEQLRALEHGFRIRTVETHFYSLGVYPPADVAGGRGRGRAHARA
jgi:3-deoxy-manno-octulosonate cytidylyltransferase (CMP-KDO synthetase)